MEEKPVEFLYRYQEYWEAPWFDEYTYSKVYPEVKLRLQKYRIVKRTPKGAWISLYDFPPYCANKFVLLSARRRYACPTEKEALESFLARKRKQYRILKRKLVDISILIQQAEYKLGIAEPTLKTLLASDQIFL